MSAKTADDIAGLEFDWLASDADGAVGFFSTAGGGYAPDEFLRDTDAHDQAIEVILARPACTEARSEPEVAAGLPNTWRLMAERGVFAFDSDPNGGPYRLVAVPRDPIRVADLPERAASVARRIVFRTLRFSTSQELTADLLARRR